MSCPSFVVAVAIATVVGPQSSLPAHLAAWEKAMAETTIFHCARLTLTHRNMVLRKETKSVGSFQALKPDCVRLRVAQTMKPDGLEDPNNYTAYVVTRDVMWEYNGTAKIVKEFRLNWDGPVGPPPPGSAGAPWRIKQSWWYRLFFGMKDHIVNSLTVGQFGPGELTKRFQVRLLREDRHYLYLQLNPRWTEDQERYDHIIVALIKPGDARPAFAPACIALRQETGDSEEWLFENVTVNTDNVRRSDFDYVPPPKDWKVEKVPSERGQGGQ
ncbi:TIGR03009 domain-containing protein [Fimbriiglobus ruber]|uniref:Outer membrane lipoprotein-sorting protein n=1 Tax=Fimbriiglobus ruber TaxID=1908690 RepID=A0A225DM68_9BACT|nr:TIGR03009 domain-containing protein [Fimbriiglobus ruber]OWK37545.1 hypothetical protein FRUB_06665 [Fimbriiglobus ruber]